MVDPVIAADGHSYEWSAICEWLQHNSTSPVTHVALAHMRLVSNVLIKKAIGQQQEQQQEQQQQQHQQG